MNLLQNQKHHCPYCGELIELLIDCSLPQQTYVEDCSVCCRPIAVSITCYEEDAYVQLLAEDE